MWQTSHQAGPDQPHNHPQAPAPIVPGAYPRPEENTVSDVPTPDPQPEPDDDDEQDQPAENDEQDGDTTTP